MKQIVFKNGHTFNVTQKVGNILKDQIMKGCNKYQVFTKDNDELDFMVNVDDISLIKDI